ncbi:hypothetical protein ACFVAQ_45875 [Streptomyces sp. NPDC057651]|uniref:hypothetical protein n=1 Tax=Streptomyces sp. NPDC057651 TaxID=3346194 RepID=UPI00367B682A
MTTIAVPLAARRAADDLAAVREQWGDLLAAIERPPAAEWPPREARGFLDQLATDERAHDDDEQPAGRVGRTPLMLREHPAPLNLDALDAALAVERDLFDLADALAEQVQRPVRRRPSLNIPSYSGRTAPDRVRMVTDTRDRDDPARWHYQTQTSPGSRAYGLHWAAVWVEGRLLGEDPGDLFQAVPPLLLAHAVATAAGARRNLERALGRDGRTTTLDDPCPWCAGPLTGRTRPGGEPLVTCSTGRGCGAPVVVDERGRRVWRGPDLVGLFVALDTARRSG